MLLNAALLSRSFNSREKDHLLYKQLTLQQKLMCTMLRMLFLPLLGSPSSIFMYDPPTQSKPYSSPAFVFEGRLSW